jgi:transcriptional activator SPT7
MSFIGSAQLGHGDSAARSDEGIGYSASSRTSQDAFEDSQDAQLVSAAAVHDGDRDNMDDDDQAALFRELYTRSEARIAALFAERSDKEDVVEEPREEDAPQEEDTHMEDAGADVAPKAVRRNIDEDDDYDDYDEEEEEHDTRPPLISKNSGNLLSPSKSGSSPADQSDKSPTKLIEKDKEVATAQPQPKTSEDARKQLEADKKATEDAVKRSFNSIFYTLENDRVAMLEQQKLEESEKQIDAEMDRGNNAPGGHGPNGEVHGTLSSANLGASSLTLKHLIARIDLKRDQVRASDAELRSLMNEVRKNRSKWASEENVGQEELYEAAEKVLSELKAMTEYSAPFLTRVNKRDAPDYYSSKYRQENRH